MEEDPLVTPAMVPGLAVYCKNPMKGLLFFRRNMPMTIGTYGVVAAILIYNLRVSLKNFYYTSVPLIILEVWVMIAAIGMVGVKAWMYFLLRKIDARLPHRELKQAMVRFFTRRIYKTNLNITNHMKNLSVLAIGMLTPTVFLQMVFSQSSNCYLPILAVTLSLFRYKMLTKEYQNTFSHPENSYQDNPYHMEAIKFNEQLLERFPRMRDNGICSVCMGEYQPEDDLLRFGCPQEHFFHRDCISRWLIKSNKCPVCQDQIY